MTHAGVSRTAAATERRRAAQDQAGLRRLELILGEAGIDEDRFVQVAGRAIEELRGSMLEAEDPRTQLTAAEADALSSAGLDLRARRRSEPDPRVETAARYAAILADSSDVGEVAQRLGVTRARVRQRAVERTLLAFREDDEWRFPRAQFAADAPIRGLPAVSLALPSDLHPV